MKVLLINTTNSLSSTGRTCQEIQDYLVCHKVECRLAYADPPRGPVPAGDFCFGNAFGSRIHSAMSHIGGREGYYSSSSTRALIRFLAEYRPDVVHLFVLHSHILNLGMLFGYLQENHIPVIVNLDDCWWFTGKCMHFLQHDCRRFETECGHCPAQHDSPDSFFFDCSRQMQADKKEWLSHGAAAISVSQWIHDQAEQSAILKGHRNEVVYNWIDRSVFRPAPAGEARPDKRTIVSVSSFWVEGSDKLRRLQKFAACLDPEKEQLLVAGECAHPFQSRGVQFLGRLKDPRELARLYQSADVYVHMSDRDTFGKVIAEAMACGTPCVVLDRTALPELVTADCGRVCASPAAADLYRACEEVLAAGREHYSEACQKRAEALFDMNRNISRILEIYRGMASGRPAE